jgi:hypothetical protein
MFLSIQIAILSLNRLKLPQNCKPCSRFLPNLTRQSIKFAAGGKFRFGCGGGGGGGGGGLCKGWRHFKNSAEGSS